MTQHEHVEEDEGELCVLFSIFFSREFVIN